MRLGLVGSLKKRLIAFVVVVYLSLGGCTVIYKTTGNVLIGFADEEAIPYILTMTDVDMVCAMSESFAPFFFSFGNVTAPPDQLAILFYMASAGCSEAEAWEEEFRYLRALKAKNVPEAQDARIAQKRALTKAATRQLTGYQKLVKVYGEPGGQCPEFNSNSDEFYYLIGLLNGLQALFNDIAAEASADVPLSIAMKVGRATKCLDNQEWWGIPGAVQAAVWTALPNSIPDPNIDPFKYLSQSVEIGLSQGVRVVQVIEAQVFLGQGDMARVKQVIRKHVEVVERDPGNSAVAALDAIARIQLQAISDRFWTQATGKRTPIGGLGTFWDDHEDEEEAIDIDDLL